MPQHYLDNRTLAHELAQSKKNGRATEALGGMLLTMAAHITQHRRFSGYQYRDDLIGAAVLHALTVYPKFRARKGNAFSWCTSVLSNACRRYIAAENRQTMLAQRFGEAASSTMDNNKDL